MSVGGWESVEQAELVKLGVCVLVAVGNEDLLPPEAVEEWEAV